MFRIINNKPFEDGTSFVEAVCLSTDEKPTEGIAAGSFATEGDTGDVYFFGAGTWAKKFSFEQ